MTRDNTDRLAMFAYQEVEVRRLALNFDQVKQYRPPPNPAKETDSRSDGYIEKFGNKSWELDALEPSIINSLIEREIESLIDFDLWEEDEAAEKKAVAKLMTLARDWETN